MRRQQIGVVALVAAAVASPAWGEGCGSDASFAALASAECDSGLSHRGWHEAHGFDVRSAAALQGQGKGASQAGTQGHAPALNAVPEPGTMALLIAGLLAMAYRFVRRIEF